jgi:hypothetical protein
VAHQENEIVKITYREYYTRVLVRPCKRTGLREKACSRKVTTWAYRNAAGKLVDGFDTRKRAREHQARTSR